MYSMRGELSAWSWINGHSHIEQNRAHSCANILHLPNQQQPECLFFSNYETTL